MRLFAFVLSTFIGLQVFAAEVKVDTILRDANASYQTGDLYRAIGMYEILLEQKPEMFYEKALEGFVSSSSVLNSKSEFIKQCERLIDGAKQETYKSNVYYYCGKQLLLDREIPESDKFLAKITKPEIIVMKGNLLRATGKMGKGDAEGCLKLLPLSVRDDFAKENMVELFQLTRARCEIVAQKFEDAIKDYQSIATSSKYYLDAVQETAWVYFKQRKMESAKVLLAVLIAAHEGVGAHLISQEATVDSASYYQARYLYAYLELVQNRFAGAEDLFEKLKADFRKFSQTEGQKTVNIQKIAEDTVKKNGEWIDLKGMSKDIGATLDFIQMWGGGSLRYSLEKQILLSMSLSRELSRYTKGSYAADESRKQSLSDLQKKVNEFLTEEMKTKYQLSLAARNTMELKSELGKIEISWLNRTQGVRNFDQVIEQYKEELKTVDDYLGI